MSKHKLFYRIIRIVKGIAKALSVLLASYVLFLLVGLMPVNNDFHPTKDGVEIYISSGNIHADIIVPISNSVIDWRGEFPPETFLKATDDATHACFGWGDKGFYLDTPTWGELKVSTAINAMLLPSDSCLHITFSLAKLYSKNSKPVRISEDQYAKLVDFIMRAFKTDVDGRKIQIAGQAYAKNDAFFEAYGSYHALYTCNSWVGQAVKLTGIRVPLFTPLPKTPMLYLPTTWD